MTYAEPLLAAPSYSWRSDLVLASDFSRKDLLVRGSGDCSTDIRSAITTSNVGLVEAQDVSDTPGVKVGEVRVEFGDLVGIGAPIERRNEVRNSVR